MGLELFKKVAAVGGLKKRQLKPPYKLPLTCNPCAFKLDGRLGLDVIFMDTTTHMVVYVKRDAYDSLLLSEEVCDQLEIVTYHPQVNVSKFNQSSVDKLLLSALSVCIQLVESVCLTFCRSTYESES